MRREEPNRHGRVADALIASYVRELLADDQTEGPVGGELRAEPAQAPLAPTSSDELAAEAAL
jgi:hypothetical protein